MNDIPQFQIVLIRPQGYVHSDAFMEIAETLLYAFRKLCCIVTLEENKFSNNSTNIILGANLLSERDVERIPVNSIIYNFEQLSKSSPWMTHTLYNLFKKFDLWDYSQRNIELLHKMGIKKNVYHVPIGYVEEMSRIELVDNQDIDVLFYGSMNPRRETIIKGLRKAGLKVETLFGVYGRARDEYIARAKVILNVHFYETNIFEVVRVSYLLANEKAVISEFADNTEIDQDLQDAVALAPYDKLVEKCVALVQSDKLRHALERRGYAAMKSRNECDYLRPIIVQSPESKPTSTISVSAKYPTKINIGSGKNFRTEFLNMDFSPYWKPDIVADLSEPDLLGQTFTTKRFGDVTLVAGTFHEIIANDVLEHIPDLVTAMTNCLNLLKEGGDFKINVPYDLSYGAWQDPTHVRAFNERSWLYYTDWFWYLGWKEARFDLTDLNYNLSPFGIKLREQGINLENTIRHPRAVDSMLVTLRKRSLTDEEHALAIQMTCPSR